MQLEQDFYDYLHAKKWTSSFTSFLRYYMLRNPAIWLADTILAQPKILQDMGLVVKYQQQY